METDKDRLDWLERVAHEPGGLLLHSETSPGRRGLGLAERTLRDAIDEARRGEAFRAKRAKEAIAGGDHD